MALGCTITRIVAAVAPLLTMAVLVPAAPMAAASPAQLTATYSKGTLRCGNGAWGYRHIQGRHQSEWGGLAVIEGKNWRDIADMAIAKSMDSPDIDRPMGNGKYCYSGQIYLINKVRGTVEKTVQPTVIVRQLDNTIITAYPGGACRV